MKFGRARTEAVLATRAVCIAGGAATHGPTAAAQAVCTRHGPQDCLLQADQDRVLRCAPQPPCRQWRRREAASPAESACAAPARRDQADETNARHGCARH